MADGPVLVGGAALVAAALVGAADAVVLAAGVASVAFEPLPPPQPARASAVEIMTASGTGGLAKAGDRHGSPRAVVRV